MILFPVSFMEVICVLLPLSVSGNAVKENWERQERWVLALTLRDNDSSGANEPLRDVLVLINERCS